MDHCLVNNKTLTIGRIAKTYDSIALQNQILIKITSMTLKQRKDFDILDQIVQSNFNKRYNFEILQALVEKLSFMTILCHFGCIIPNSLRQLRQVIPNIHVALDHFLVTFEISCHFG